MSEWQAYTGDTVLIALNNSIIYPLIVNGRSPLSLFIHSVDKVGWLLWTQAVARWRVRRQLWDWNTASAILLLGKSGQSGVIPVVHIYWFCPKFRCHGNGGWSW